MTVYKKIIQILTLQERQQLLVLVMLILLGMLFEVMGLGLVLPLIGLMTQSDLIHKYPSIQPYLNFIGNPSPSKLLIEGMLVLVGIFCLKTAFLTYNIWKQNSFIFNAQANLSFRFFQGYLFQPWSFHLQRNSAELMRNIMTETNFFISGVLQQGVAFITEGFVLLGVITVLFIVEPIGTTIIVVLLGFFAFIFQYAARKRLLNWGESRQSHEGFRLQHLQQGFGGMKDIKLLGRENAFIMQYNLHNKGVQDVAQKQKFLADLPRLCFELLAICSLAFLVIIMLMQKKTIDALLPILGLFAVASFRILPAVVRLLSSMQVLRYNLPVVHTLHKECGVLFTRSPLKQNQKKSILIKEILLENISFQYAEVEQKALKGINLVIHHGDSVGFIGASGAGKSTLIDILLGLLIPTKGCVKINGVDIQTDLRGWQNRIGYVPQSIFLTDDSLRHNIAFGLSDNQIDDAAVRRALKAAQLEEFIQSLPNGMETLVGERGVRLSGGQRQRIGIARALYHDPDILVLDEATSALDTTTEKAVMKAVNALQGNKTLVIIAHRLSTLANCDCIYMIESGKIIKKDAPQSITQREHVVD
jgi:ABC-type multidrug transport system fused ATPase/permease subunit